MATIASEPLAAILTPVDDIFDDESLPISAARAQANGNGNGVAPGLNKEPQREAAQKAASGREGVGGSAKEASASKVRLSGPLLSGPYTDVCLPASRTAVH